MGMNAFQIRLTVTIALFAGVLLAGRADAQHAGDIGLRVVNDQLEVYGPLGEPEDSDGVYLGVFGDTGFPGYTPNPGFDASPGTLPSGRIGFTYLDGLKRWDAEESVWLDVEQVGESLRVSFITVETIIEDDPIVGFSLAVQPDGGWHRHVNFELQPDGDGVRTPGVYRIDLSLYADMGLAESEPFTILFDYEADPEEVSSALDSMYEDDSCPADYDGSGAVDGGDLSVLLGAWASSDPTVDLSGNDFVDGQDLSILLGLWGVCPE